MEGIKGVYQDSERPELYYYWDGSSWIATQRSDRDATDLRLLYRLLTDIKRLLPDEFPAVDGVLLFSFYDVDHPKGAGAFCQEAEALLKAIRQRAGQLADVYTVYGGGTKARLDALLKQRANYEEKTFNDYVHHPDIHQRLLYQYLKGYRAERSGVYRELQETAKKLKALNLHAVWGRVDASEPYKTLKLEAKLSGGGAILEKAAKAGQKEYNLLVEAANDSVVTFTLAAETARSQPVSFSAFTGNPLHQVNVKLAGAHFRVKLTAPTQAACYDPVTLSAQIDGGQPPFAVEWRAGRDVLERTNMTMDRNVSARTTFNQTGRLDLLVTVSELQREGPPPPGPPATDQAVITISDLDMKLNASALVLEPGAPVKIQVTVSGGTKPYTLSADINLALKDSNAWGELNMPNEPGTYPINVTARDKTGATVERSLVLRVKKPGRRRNRPPRLHRCPSRARRRAPAAVRAASGFWWKRKAIPTTAASPPGPRIGPVTARAAVGRRRPPR